MQSTVPNQQVVSATYSSFDADEQYRNAHQETVQPIQQIPKVKRNVESHPNGSTLIQTETPTKHQGGILGKVENLKLRAGEHLGIGTDSATRWSLYQLNEPLFAEFKAKVVNGSVGYSKGFLLISSAHLCFSSFTDNHNRAIKIAIPLKNIYKIGLAQRLRNTPGSAVVLTPLCSLSMKANSLQVFTKDGILHQFFGFRKKTEQMFNTLNHAWQSTGVVGIENINNNIPIQQSPYQQAVQNSGFRETNINSLNTYGNNQGVLPSQFISGGTSSDVSFVNDNQPTSSLKEEITSLNQNNTAPIGYNSM